jgi:hypothetical protein
MSVNPSLKIAVWLCKRLHNCGLGFIVSNVVDDYCVGYHLGDKDETTRKDGFS